MLGGVVVAGIILITKIIIKNGNFLTRVIMIGVLGVLGMKHLKRVHTEECE